MEVRALKVPARDGFELAATLYSPAAPVAVDRFVLITSATGVKRRYYDKYARFLAEQGLPCLTFDYRGIGDSGPRSLRRFQATMRDWAEQDIAGVIDWLSEHQRPAKLLVLGHSVGGQLIGLTPNNGRIAAMLAVAAQSGYWRYWPFPRRYLMAVLWYGLMPALISILGYFPAKKLGLAEDLPGGVAGEWARWCRNPQYMVDRDGQPLRTFFGAFRAPIYYYSIDDDAFAPKNAVEFMMSCYVNAPKEGRHLVPKELGVRAIGHFGLFREAFKPLLWKTTADWFQQQ